MYKTAVTTKSSGPDPVPEDRPSVRVLKPRRAAPSDAVRPTRAEINLEALRLNLRAVKRHAAARARAKVWAVLKADAYGHGAPAVARTLERAGADGFCVALLEEGVELREAGIVAPILVMGGYYPGAHAEVLARNLTPVVYDIGQVEAFAKLVRAGDAENPVRVHLKVDTGMARLGVTMQSLPALAAALGEYPEVEIDGLMTHLACAESGAEGTTEQMVLFDEATALLARHGVRPSVRHAANSAALFHEEARLDAVRPGIAIFGVSPRVAGSAEGGRRNWRSGRSPSRKISGSSCACAPRSSRSARSRRGRRSVTARSSARAATRASRRSRWATPTASRAASRTPATCSSAASARPSSARCRWT